MKSRIQRVKTKTVNVTYRPRVFFQIGISPIVSVGTHTFVHELIEVAGGINLTKGLIPYPRFSNEQVLPLKPEVFIITYMSRNTIKNHRIHLEDSNFFNRPTPHLVDGLEHLARRIHPKLYRPEISGKEK